MQSFISNIFAFVRSISLAMGQAIRNIASSDELQQYTTFMNKNIISGDLITIGLTWRELFLYLSTWFLVIFFIVYFVRLVFKVIGLVCLR